jgi:hypothetical protein
MRKLLSTIAGVALAGVLGLAALPANAWWGGWDDDYYDYYGPWGGYGPWYGGYPGYYGHPGYGWGGYPRYGGYYGYPGYGWGGYPHYGGYYGYPGYGYGYGYPQAVTPVQPSAPTTTTAQ